MNEIAHTPEYGEIRTSINIAYIETVEAAENALTYLGGGATGPLKDYYGPFRSAFTRLYLFTHKMTGIYNGDDSPAPEAEKWVFEVSSKTTLKEKTLLEGIKLFDAYQKILFDKSIIAGGK